MEPATARSRMFAVEEALWAEDKERYFALLKPLCDEQIPEAMCSMGTQYAIRDTPHARECLIKAKQLGFDGSIWKDHTGMKDL